MTFLLHFWNLTVAMAPWLLLGFLMAGILHVWIPKNMIYKHLSGRGFKPLLKSVLIGIPLPICSCGIIPLSREVHKSGASQGSTLSFMTSTPITGVDSILATHSLLGPVIAFFRVFYALIAGLLVGLLVQKSVHMKNDDVCESPQIAPHTQERTSKKSIVNSIREVWNYAFFEMIRDLRKWLILGLVMGAALTALLPVNSLGAQNLNVYVSYFLVLLIALPMYVCSTGAISIAASLVIQGMSPGAALIFLLAGPASNTATLAFVWGQFGKKVFAIYVLTLIGTAIGFGWFFDSFMSQNFLASLPCNHESLNQTNYTFWEIFCATLLLGLIMFSWIKEKFSNPPVIAKETLYIPSIHCSGCANTLRSLSSQVQGVTGIEVDVDSKMVKIGGEYSSEELRTLLIQKGFPPVETEKSQKN